MKVKIVKYSGKHYWYKNNIGETFDVYKKSVYGFIFGVYSLKGKNFGKFVNKNDVQIIN